MKILKLHGTIEEKINTMLENAGWYAGRRVNIDEAVSYYNKYGLTLSEKAKSFISEYYGLEDDWYFDTSNIDRAPDFEFNLFPYPKSYATDVVDFMYDDEEGEADSEEYAAVKALDKNACMVGEIGYYYPARVWIGDSARCYAHMNMTKRCMCLMILRNLSGMKFWGTSRRLSV